MINSNSIPYKKISVVDQGLACNHVVKTIMDRKDQYKGDRDFGMAVVNTDQWQENGFHWVVAVFLRTADEGKDKIQICLYDPLGTAKYSESVKRQIEEDAAKVDNIHIEVTASAMGMQTDGWRCGYYSVYAILNTACTFLLDEQNTVKEVNILNNVYEQDDLQCTVLKKMPDEFVQIIWCILDLVWKETGIVNQNALWVYLNTKLNIATTQVELFSEHRNLYKTATKIYHDWQEMKRVDKSSASSSSSILSVSSSSSLSASSFPPSSSSSSASSSPSLSLSSSSSPSSSSS